MLKDIILRQKVREGRRVEMRPGWDCHGLPIEQKALASGKVDDKNKLAIRGACRQFAEEAIARQARDMRRWGLLTDFETPVKSMDPSYEARQLRVFAEFIKQGLVKSDFRPVHWSPSSKSALAEAELEYRDDHTSMAVWAAFPLDNITWIDGKCLHLLIWTTTPWTLPANQAIAFSPKMKYKVVQYLVESSNDGMLLVVAESLIPTLPFAVSVVGDFDFKAFAAPLRYSNLFSLKNNLPVLPGDFVSESVGSGLVHLSPAHGMDDFNLCRQHGIHETTILINEDGTFNSKALGFYHGKSIFDPNILHPFHRPPFILHTNPNHTHRYPYDWRTKQPVIQLATRQWFIDVSTILPKVEKALEGVQIFPGSGRQRFVNMLRGRDQWCISRQRSWGLPIPAFYRNNEVLLREDIALHVANIFERQGSDAWWNSTKDDDLLPPSHQGQGWKRGWDTMDVWFDSGTFWTIHPDSPADVYLEGSDQFRGWFQSSLITSVVSRGVAPFKALISHGFTLDEQGTKMSKSIGNVINPNQVIGNKNPDVLRLWASFTNYEGDIQVGPQSISKPCSFSNIFYLEMASDAYLKFRNTFKFILGNTHDLAETQVHYSQLNQLDRAYLRRTNEVIAKYDGLMRDFKFKDAMSHLYSFVSNELSSNYFDAIKNRLYVDKVASPGRLSAQGTLAFIGNLLCSAISPIMPLLASEVLKLLPKVHIAMGDAAGDDSCLPLLNALRDPILEAIRNEVNLQSTFQAIVKVPQSVTRNINADSLKEFLLVAQVVTDTDSGIPASPPLTNLKIEFDGTLLAVEIYKSQLEKCPRCWVYTKPPNQPLCQPCDSIVSEHPISIEKQMLAN